ncbi:P-loop containing nucleoside triphosphate hydrolase protein [Massariosphaeria phaeospora]|uniref:P-loop containing nucleoside triphosphate hydrolase protein n=1 Tax=Massariosphaeria phaeospora TaxID=100035 RepID=A0A7C8IC15_9PLEO|nr:P-loop containing nucleoside triphosphate hydrolase protein [Massariosphaeria phaeospora]
MFESAVESAKDNGEDLTTTKAKKWLERAKNSLAGRDPTETALPAKESDEDRARFGQDAPGHLSVAGQRHNNDFEDIRKIQILPTFQEIICDRDPYLPVLDPSKLHLSGMDGLIDRHFRLYREEVTGKIRESLRSEVKSKRSNTGLRTNTYYNLEFEGLSCDELQGLVITVSIDQPKVVQGCSQKARKDWWESNKRLQREALVCILDPSGHAIFCTVAEIRDHQNSGKEGSGSLQGGPKKKIWQDLERHPRRAIVTLALAEEQDTSTIADYFSRYKSFNNMRLFEFPKVLLQAFRHTLTTLQSMISRKDVPFAEYLAPLQPTADVQDISPPLYAQQQNFQFNLDCLVSEGPKLILSPNESFDTNSLVRGSTLDEKQAEALAHALSRSLSLCQGPPGSGKSFSSVALLQVLLENKSTADLGPILAITYTNHALDQTLEKCLDSGIREIVRIGSGSKSERLQGFNLRDASKQIVRTRVEKHESHARSQTLAVNANHVNEVIMTLGMTDGINSLESYLENNYPVYFNQFWSKDQEGYQGFSPNPDPVIPKWLLGTSKGRPQNRTIPQLLEAECSVWGMSSSERKDLHAFWMNACQMSHRNRVLSVVKGYRKSKDALDAVRQEVDKRCLEQADIIGVTTSGLARNVGLLKRLPIKAILVEEAGEILESHTLTALLPSVEHAILIGDHLQLKPSVDNYELTSESYRGKPYSLDMSLFERLVSPPEGIPGTRLPFSTLQTQRRMHPSISALIRNTVYPNLKDDPIVSLYPEVAGMKRRLFWLDHSWPEVGSESDDQLSMSKSNDFEIAYVVCLVAHLLSQGVYLPQDIAVLTPYLGQVFKFRNALAAVSEIALDDRDVEALENAGMVDDNFSELPRKAPEKTSLLQCLKVASVDNFQGEEAKVVIVSLVRSNNANRCGFLKTSNRINVLLSRAKHGMYIVGNSRTSAGVPMWAKVIRTLKDQGNFGPALELSCTRHPDTPILASKPDDFKRHSPEGGCSLPCARRLKCGHICIQKCHPDLRHNNVKCLEPCKRTKPGCDHVCRKLCGDKCDLQCGVPVKDIDLELPCGHVVKSLLCWQSQAPKSVECTVMVVRKVPECGHPVKVECGVDVNDEDYRCTATCGARLKCGHACKQSCASCHSWGVVDHAQCECNA